MTCCTRGICATHLAEGDADYSTLIAPGHVLTCVPNTNHQILVGAVTRAVIQAWEGK